MNFEVRNDLANFGTKFGIFWQKLCEIDCNSRLLVEDFVVGTCNSCMYLVFH